jgi:hypothetical protein
MNTEIDLTVAHKDALGRHMKGRNLNFLSSPTLHFSEIVCEQMLTQPYSDSFSEELSPVVRWSSLTVTTGFKFGIHHS